MGAWSTPLPFGSGLALLATCGVSSQRCSLPLPHDAFWDFSRFLALEETPPPHTHRRPRPSLACSLPTSFLSSDLTQLLSLSLDAVDFLLTKLCLPPENIYKYFKLAQCGSML